MAINAESLKNVPYNRAWSDGFMLPKGDYWVGDPCLSLPRQDWKNLFLNSEQFPINNMFGATYKGKLVVAIGAERGDGRYVDNEGYTYTVDSGFIGFIPQAFVKEENEHGLGSISKLGRFVSFKEDFQVSVNKHGIMCENIVILTTYAKRQT